MSGGIKDINPPVVLSCNPENYSTNFKSQKIEILFDEFIVLKNVNQELIISPPLPKKPEVRIKNKTITIDLKNELRENTTYTLNFGKAIADNNEGNPLTNYEFVFSTGDFLDSLSVQGTLVNAFNLVPSKEPFIIGLYDQAEDSVPMKNIPVYVGKTDEKGHFMINNIKADTFKVFGLKDLNNNLRFDLPNEEIAFADTLLILTPEFLRSLPIRLIQKDTSAVDTLKSKSIKPEAKSGKGRKNSKNIPPEEPIVSKDTISLDSINTKPTLPALYIDLVSFLQEGTKQYMTNNDRLGKESFRLCFSLPLKENPGISLIGYENPGQWYLPEINARRDSFTYWLTDTTLINKDTIRFEVAYPMTDSMGALYTRLDTIKFVSRAPAERQGKNKSEVKEAPVKLTLSTIRNKGLLEINTNPPLGFNYPLQRTDTSRIRLYLIEDSVEYLQKFEILTDSTSLRKMELKSNWKEKGKYKMNILPGAFTDLYNHSNDTLRIMFSVQEKSFYGALTVTLSEVTSPILIQLMNEKEVVLRSKLSASDGSQVFEYLGPAKYKIKFVYDVNTNKKWDTGEYLKKTQPEKVLYYKGEINIRSNWDLEIKQSFKE